MINKRIEKEATKMFRKIYFKNNIKTFSFFKGLFLNLKLWFKKVCKQKQSTFTAEELRFMFDNPQIIKKFIDKRKRK